MTEKEKMIKGMPYDPLDKELITGRLNARRLVKEISEIPMDKERQRRHLFKELLGNTEGRFYIENPFVLAMSTGRLVLGFSILAIHCIVQG